MKKGFFIFLTICLFMFEIIRAFAGEVHNIHFYKMDAPHIGEIGLTKAQMEKVFQELTCNNRGHYTTEQLKNNFAMALESSQKGIYFVTPPVGFDWECDARLGGALYLYQKKGTVLKQIDRNNTQYQFYTCDYDYELKKTFDCQVYIGFFAPERQYLFYGLKSAQLSKIGLSQAEAEKIFLLLFETADKDSHSSYLREKTRIAQTGKESYLVVNDSLIYCKASGLYACDTFAVKRQGDRFVEDTKSQLTGQYVCDESALEDKYCCLPQANKELVCPFFEKKDKK